MAPALLFVVFLLFFVAMVAWATAHAKKAEGNFQRLAHQLGLTPAHREKRFGVHWSQPSATGEIRNRPARLFSYATGSGKSRTSWVALALQPCAHGGLTFQITQQGLGSKIRAVFGAKEITTGDVAFDAAWFIQTNQSAFFQAALIPELRARLTAALTNSSRAQRSSFHLSDGIIAYNEVGDFGSEQRCARVAHIAEVLSDFVDLVEVFAQQAPPDADSAPQPSRRN